MARTVQYILFEDKEKAQFAKLLNLPDKLWEDYAASVELTADLLKDVCVTYLVKNDVVEGDLQHAVNHVFAMYGYACDHREDLWPTPGQADDGISIISYTGGLMNRCLGLFIQPGGNWR